MNEWYSVIPMKRYGRLGCITMYALIQWQNDGQPKCIGQYDSEIVAWDVAEDMNQLALTVAL